jgi:hypothetical protein
MMMIVWMSSSWVKRSRTLVVVHRHNTPLVEDDDSRLPSIHIPLVPFMYASHLLIRYHLTLKSRALLQALSIFVLSYMQAGNILSSYRHI